MSDPIVPRSVDDSAQESLRALIHAIAPETNKPEGKNTVDKLAQKLSELVGVGAPDGSGHSRNERGELVNEEGLPVVEINEAVDDEDVVGPQPGTLTNDPLIPLSSLSAEERLRLRERNDRILDQLEEEERQLELAEQRAENEQRQEAARRRKEREEQDAASRKAAKELQKKMGRALLQNVKKGKEKAQDDLENERRKNEEADKSRKSPPAKKKTVAFVESLGLPSPDEDPTESKTIDWGDITPARLRDSKRPTLISQTLRDRQPIKMNVVERVPGGRPTVPAIAKPNVADSDDESDATLDDDEEHGDAELDPDEADLDYAAHQREVALEYYRRRNEIGQETAAVMKNHTHDDDEPTSEGQSHRHAGAPPISQFKANRLAAAYGASLPTPPATAGTSLGDTVLPASAARTMQHAIRSGKLDDDSRLVGGDQDSASEEEEGLQDVIDLLRKGQVYNVGPEGTIVFEPPSPSVSTEKEPPISDTKRHQPPTLPPLNVRNKTSKFKASRTAGLSTHLEVPGLSSAPLTPMSPTPISDVRRSSPKEGTTPISERQGPWPALSISQTLATPTTAYSPSSTVIDSPSFPFKPPKQAQFPSMIVESPSFPRPVRPAQLPTVMASTVVESSSKATPRTSGVSPQVRHDVAMQSVVLERRPQRPPTIFSSKELAAEGNATEQPKKVSRFKSERG